MSRLPLRLLFSPLILCLAAASALAQGSEGRTQGQPMQGQIQGQVRIAGSGQPAFNVLVSCDAFQGGFIGQERTDRNGRFAFRNLSPVQYVISIREPGYREEQQTVELQTTPSAYLQFQLKPDPSAASTSPIGIAPVGSGALDLSVPAEAQKEFEAGRKLVLDETKKGNLEEGIHHLEKAVTLYPKYLDAEVLLGTSYVDAKQWDKAEAALRRALEINPKATTAAFALGDLYRHQKKYAEAEKTLTDALATDDKSAQGHYILGRVYFEQNNLAKAGPHVGRALQLKPDFAEAHLLAGNILLRARQPENALAEFEEYLRLDPKGEFADQARQISQKIKDALAAQKKK